MAKRKRKKKESEFQHQLRLFKRRVKAAEKAGFLYTGKTPRTAKQAKAIRAEQIRTPEAAEAYQQAQLKKLDETNDTEVSNEPVDKIQAIQDFTEELINYISDWDFDYTVKNQEKLYQINQIRNLLVGMLQDAENHYGKEELARYLSNPETMERLKNAVDSALKNYKKSGNTETAEFATILNGGPLTADQAMQLEDAGRFDFYDDELPL